MKDKRVTLIDKLLDGIYNHMKFENSREICVVSKLTNAYCLVVIGGSENFYRLVIHILLVLLVVNSMDSEL